jgi:CubicO group peptidase (beta-lactamase class C family)
MPLTTSRSLGCILLLASLTGSGAAQDPPVESPLPQPRGITDRGELQAYLDGMVTALMRDKHIAGATISVVKDGQLYFSKGYGWADVDKRIPVDPGKTLFRIGSVSKLFTWTAIMQLVEQGKLDLNTDINAYLDFKIPDTYPEKITLTHVLTHTPGFEEDGRDLFTEDPDHLTPMGTWLPAHMPNRVRPPGVYSSYSNWATAVAGYIVERTSGQSWDEYIEANILGPLSMSQTTGRQPLPERYDADMARAYAWEKGRFESKPWEIITGAAPAGSMSASANDMARFMLAHLNRGALGESRILSDSTTRLMHTQHFTHDPRLAGFALGFYETKSHGLRLIGHGGDTRYHHTELALIPEDNVGLFVSFNTDTGGEISFEPFLETFLDHYYPTAPLPVQTTNAADAARLAGEYQFNRKSYTTWQKAMGLAGAIPIAAEKDGSLLMTTPFGAMRLDPVDSLLYQDRISGHLVAFKTDANGQATHAFLDFAPMMTLERQGTLQSSRLHQAVLIMGLVVALCILIAAWFRWLNRRRLPPPEPSVRTGRRLLLGAALLLLLFPVGVGVVASNPSTLMNGPYTPLYVVLALPVLAGVLTLIAAWFGLKQWREGAGTVGGRLRYAGAIAMFALVLWSLNTWNLLGWRT